jgi:hypothetical protein
MYDIKITLPLTSDEHAALYILTKNLEINKKLRAHCDYAILIPLFQRIIDKSLLGTFIDPLNTIDI